MMSRWWERENPACRPLKRCWTTPKRAGPERPATRSSSAAHSVCPTMCPPLAHPRAATTAAAILAPLRPICSSAHARPFALSAPLAGDRPFSFPNAPCCRLSLRCPPHPQEELVYHRIGVRGPTCSRQRFPSRGARCADAGEWTFYLRVAAVRVKSSTANAKGTPLVHLERVTPRHRGARRYASTSRFTHHRPDFQHPPAPAHRVRPPAAAPRRHQ